MCAPWWSVAQSTIRCQSTRSLAFLRGWVDPDNDWLYISINFPQPRSPPMTRRSERCPSDPVVVRIRQHRENADNMTVVSMRLPLYAFHAITSCKFLAIPIRRRISDLPGKHCHCDKVCWSWLSQDRGEGTSTLLSAPFQHRSTRAGLKPTRQACCLRHLLASVTSKSFLQAYDHRSAWRVGKRVPVSNFLF